MVTDTSPRTSVPTPKEGKADEYPCTEAASTEMSETALIREKLVDIPVDPPGVRFSFKTFCKYAGPGWLMSLAYLDPGNLEADLQAGAFTGFQMLWVLLLAHIFGLILQVLACRIGAVSGYNLAENCRRGYPRLTANVLWIMSEVAIIGSDIQEVLGTAIALNVLTGLPIWAGTLITVVDTLTFLVIHMFHGIRILEAFIFVLIAIMMGCFFADMAISSPPASEVAAGFIPEVSSYAIPQMVGMIGAVIMPHNLYLHSALVGSRKIDRMNQEHVRQANKYFLVDACSSLVISFVINLALVSAFAYSMFSQKCAEISSGPLACLTNPTDWSTDVCDPSTEACQCLTPEGLTGVCASVGLENAATALSFAMNTEAVKYIFAIGVLAAGQASTLTGTLAGQYVMEGFMRWKIPIWLRVVITRGIALGPALTVAILQSEIQAMNGVNAWLNILQSIQLPFALLPVLHFSACKDIMKKFTIGVAWSAVVWFLAVLVIVINAYLVVTTLIPLSWPWYAWTIIGVVAIFYMVLCYRCVSDDLKRIFGRFVSLATCGSCRRSPASTLDFDESI